MRIWSVHPRYLDRQGLTAGWREALLAQKVLAGGTRGYRNHPQLRRFGVPADTVGTGALADPGPLVVTYLHGLADEADARGYSFDRSRVMGPPGPGGRIEVTEDQLDYEWGHLLSKLAARSPDVLARWLDLDRPEPHPLFVVVPGPVADWEVTPAQAVATSRRARP